MKITVSLLSAAALAAVLTAGVDAAAQSPTHPASTTAVPAPARARGAAGSKPTTTRTADYTETGIVGGDSIVTFTGDELVGPAGGPYGDAIRRPPGVTRVGLIRARMNFVAELVASVENL